MRGAVFPLIGTAFRFFAITATDDGADDRFIGIPHNKRTIGKVLNPDTVGSAYGRLGTGEREEIIHISRFDRFALFYILKTH